MQCLVPPLKLRNAQSGDGRRGVHHQFRLLFEGKSGEQVLCPSLSREVRVLIRKELLALRGIALGYNTLLTLLGGSIRCAQAEGSQQGKRKYLFLHHDELFLSSFLYIADKVTYFSLNNGKIWQKSLKFLSFADRFVIRCPLARKLQIQRVKAEARRARENERIPSHDSRGNRKK